MPRAKVDLGEEWRESVAATLAPRLMQELSRGALSESEILAVSTRVLGVDSSPAELVSGLKKMYKMQFRESLSDRTALKEVLFNLKKAVELTKAKLVSRGVKMTGRKFQFGKDFAGRIFYLDNNQLQKKVRELLKKQQAAVATQLLVQLDKRNYVRLKQLPLQPRAISLATGLLVGAGLAELKGEFLVSPGFDISTIQLEEVRAREDSLAEFFEKQGFDASAPYTAGCWVIGEDGPKVVRLVFAVMAFDGKTRQIHLADRSKKRADVSKLRSLRRKTVDWGLPSIIHFFAPSFTPAAEKYAKRWGIMTHKTI